VETERALLSAILLGPEQILAAVEVLPSTPGSYFYQEAHRYIYDAMLTLFERRDPIDLYHVTDMDGEYLATVDGDRRECNCTPEGDGGCAHVRAVEAFIKG
jgi:replicative DNA helicase